ncbi:hypothetical protein F0562_006649 [Nyssa sinensis]|uniref:Uncharacterized protein n=1 Tax=Nyssa sinensis TaxID=561372 RepID=A0A5J5AMU9_9ASTE|nr:hypothetical protein F0562_006649 [Nyssa sinensis]
MESIWAYSSLSVLLLVITFKFLSQRRAHRHNLPPSPLALPVIGHLHLLKQPLHRTLHNLSQKHGPILSLQLGTRLTIVVSSSSAVEECFTKNDIVLANRPKFVIGKYIGYNYSTMAGAPYGEHWRNLRRLSALEIFSSSRLNMFLSIRQDEIKLLLRKLNQNSSRDLAKVELKSKFSELTFNIIMRMIAGKRYFGDDVADYEEAKQVRELIREIFKYGGASNLGDFLPMLRWIDYQNLEKNLTRLGKKMDSFLQGLIDEHRRDKSTNSMIDHLLSLQESEPEYYTDQIIKGLIMAMILAGTDTSAVTIEWAMDPKFWDDPTSFKPERFEGGDVEAHKLMPFGMGRRACPGAGLAQRVVGLTLGSLIQCFEWERVSEMEVDLTEGKGLTMPKAEPLEAMCKAREIMHKVSCK